MLRTSILAIALATTVAAQNPAASVTVDAAANRHAIDPRIYGVAFGTTTQLSDLNVALNRYGGDETSRYNWQLNADNRGKDWYFESIGDSSSVSGERGDTFISNTQTAGARAMITIPMLDWVAKLGPSRAKLASFSQAKYGAQTGDDSQWFPDAGNGILKSTGQDVTGNDPNDANAANSSSYQQQWVQEMVSKWGLASSSAPRYYLLDNESSIWYFTHRDVHPVGATMDEILARIADYASQIRAADPGALIVGPEEWGWSGYFYSGYDQQYGSLHGWSYLPDRTNHGGADYLPWLLRQLKADGRHLLDVFTVHYYPQGGEFSNDVSTATQLLRNQSTRSLWDPNYVDQSWINDKVMLIPRLRNWVNTDYGAGTPIGITEYNWGAEAYINGATAQADILGIFGREGVDLATRWTTPDASTPTYKAIKLYRNYDGNKSTFGDVSVSAGGPNPDNLAVFAAQRTSDSALTVMVISKYLSGTTQVSLTLNNFSPSGTAQIYQLTSANTITRLADLSFNGITTSFTAAAQSITLLVFPAGAPNTSPVAMASANPTSGVAPLAVSFSSAGSNDPDGSIVSYSWNFGDGSAASNVASPSHTYQTAGGYTAVLTVTDNRGATGVAQVAITVSPNPNALNAPTRLTGTAGRGSVTLQWTDNSSNESGFYVERAPSGTTSFARVGSVGVNVTTFKDTVSKGTYLYRVQAFNATSVSAYSNTVTVRVTK
ncbi:MAG TPA: glycoside hydrolase family 44 protein [Bryobacteraceae bacterium]|nr:glycoside hydrolase family 44 protein [Bryobacteraceae bacterium]